MKNRIAAPTTNSAPITRLSRALTGKEWNNNPPRAPGQIQQTAPATAKAMANTFIGKIATSPHLQDGNVSGGEHDCKKRPRRSGARLSV